MNHPNPASLPNQHGAYQDRYELMRTIGDIAYSRTSFFRYYHTPDQVNAFLRNEGRMLGIIERSSETANIMSAAAILLSVPNINNVIPGAGLPPGFWDSVPVFLTPEQLAAALQPFVPHADNTDVCCICQENLNTRPACELAQCHHHLHRACAEQWFAMSTRCPVCRASAA